MPIDSKKVVERSAITIGERSVRGEECANGVAVEEPLQIRVDCNPVAVTMRSPGDDEVLALGFLYAEGIVSAIDQVGRIVASAESRDASQANIINVLPHPGASLEMVRVMASRRGTLTTSACGVCGRDSIDDLLARCQRLPDGPVISAERLMAMMVTLSGAQPAFERTGGVHAAGLFAADGTLLCCHEDIGRHNAVDKVVGTLFREGGIPANGSDLGRRAAVLTVSGRASFEIIQKAVVAGIPIVASVSAPSSLAVDLARASNATLAAFVRGSRAELFSGVERIAGGPA